MGRGDMRGDGLPAVPRSTQEQRHAAALTVCERATGTADARALLLALGIIEPPPPPPPPPPAKPKRAYTDQQREAALQRKRDAHHLCQRAAAVLGMTGRAYMDAYGQSMARARAIIEQGHA